MGTVIAHGRHHLFPAATTQLKEKERVAIDEVVLDWPYTQSELASMIGGTRQTVNRLLSDMVAEGLLRVEKDTIVIPSLERLAHAAER